MFFFFLNVSRKDLLLWLTTFIPVDNGSFEYSIIRRRSDIVFTGFETVVNYFIIVFKTRRA